MPSTNPFDYPNMGMRVPLTADDLVYDRRLKQIVHMRIEQQAEYADMVCVANAGKVEFCKSQLGNFLENPQYEKWNSTSVGNVAYLALYGCIETREQYREVLEKGIIHFRAKFANEESGGSCSLL